MRCYLNAYRENGYIFKCSRVANIASVHKGLLSIFVVPYALIIKADSPPVYFLL